MAGPGSYAHAVVGEAESFDRAAHTVTIMENDLAPMAIVAFEIGLSCSDKIARDPGARADRAKIGHLGQGPFIPAQSPACKILAAIAKTSQERRATVAAIGDIYAIFVRNGRSCGCKCVNQGQQHWQV